MLGVTDRQIQYWEDMGLPNVVATHQAQWERRQEMVRMHNSGMIYAEIGAAIGITGARVGQIIGKQKRKRYNTPPVMLHLTRWGEMHDLTMSEHTMQFIGWLAGGDEPTEKLRTRIYRKMRKAPFSVTDAEINAIWDAIAQHEKADH
jgi:hypothetical protein